MADFCGLHLGSIRTHNFWKNACADFYSSNAPQIHNEEHGSGGQAGAEPGAGPGAGGGSAEGQPTWVNSLVGRIFWDFLREKYWTDQVAHKIQKKLSKIKVRVDEDGDLSFRETEALG